MVTIPFSKIDSYNLFLNVNIVVKQFFACSNNSLENYLNFEHFRQKNWKMSLILKFIFSILILATKNQILCKYLLIKLQNEPDGNLGSKFFF